MVLKKYFLATNYVIIVSDQLAERTEKTPPSLIYQPFVVSDVPVRRSPSVMTITCQPFCNESQTLLIPALIMLVLAKTSFIPLEDHPTCP